MATQKQAVQQQLISDIPELQKLFDEVMRYLFEDGRTKRIALYRKIESRARKLKAEKELGIIHSVIAKYYLDRQQYKATLKYIFKALPIMKKYGLANRISKLYNWLAGVYLFSGDYSNALDYFQMEIEHNIKSGIEQHCFIAYNMMGNIYYDIGDDETAEKFYLKAKDIAARYPDFGDVQISTAHLNTAIIVLKIRQEKREEAESLCFETIEITKGINDKRIMPNLFSSLSLIYYDRGDYEKGLHFAAEAEKHLNRDDVEGYFSVAKQKAYNLTKLGNKKAAVVEFKKCLKHIDKIPTMPMVRIELLHRAAALFETMQLKKDLRKVQKLLRETELSYQTLQSKLAIRAAQLIDFTNKYAPAELRSDPDELKVHVIGSKVRVSIPVSEIYACETGQDNLGKNNSRIYVRGNTEPYRVPSSLKTIYAMLNSLSFAWINRNAFINWEHVEDMDEIKHERKVTLYQKVFKVSRSRRKIITENFLKRNTVSI